VVKRRKGGVLLESLAVKRELGVCDRGVVKEVENQVKEWRLKKRRV